MQSESVITSWYSKLGFTMYFLFLITRFGEKFLSILKNTKCIYICESVRFLATPKRSTVATRN